MSEDRTNEEEEENKNEFFDDGDDFGLPDLDYDELDEESDDTPLEEEIEFDAPADTEDSSLDFGSDDSTDDVPAYDEDSISTDDLTAEDFEISDEELEGIEENVESFSDDDLSFGGDSYGDFEPDPDAAAFAAESSEATDDGFLSHSDGDSAGSEYRYADEKSRSSFTKIVIIGTVIILVLASGFWWYSTRGDRAAEAQNTTPPPAKEDPKPDPTPVATDTAQAKPVESTPTTPPPQPQAQARPQQQRPQPAASNPGEIRTITERTGNSFIIIGSFVDEDLANDYAKKLASSGESPTIISPPGNQLFYRVAIASFNSYDEAAQALNDFRPNFGEDAWAFRY